MLTKILRNNDAANGGSVDRAYLSDADWRLEKLDDEINMGQHFELCCGGYEGSATIIGEIYDAEAVAHFVDIRMGLPGMPARKIATYQPMRLSDALDAFFLLGELGMPLYYIGGSMCLHIGDKDELIEKMAEAWDLEEGDVEDLVARCDSPGEGEEVMDASSFQRMSKMLGPFNGGLPI